MSTNPKWKVLSQLSAILLGVLALPAGAGLAAPATDGKTREYQLAAGETIANSAVAAGTVFLAANLGGRNEVPVPGGPAVGDPDGRGRAVVRIQGTQVCFTTAWSGIAAPTAAHIHAGGAGTNGAVVVDLLAGAAPGVALPGSLRAVTGCVAGAGATVAAVQANPADFYVNLHTNEFPGGAVRGPLHASRPIDLLGMLRGPLAAVADGGQEEPDLGDPDGRATGFVRARHRRIDFAVTWQGIAPPTLGHIHAGRVGVAGPVAVDLFVGGGPLPGSLSAVAGEVDGVDPALAKQIARNPAEFYLNLHNAEFPRGAVRGQLFRAGSDDAEAATFTAAVVKGVQIYACAAQPDGSLRFTQHNVRAVLEGNIKHSFVTNTTGPPQWIAPDRSAVTGRLISRTPNGVGNIDELELEATQNGERPGKLARTVEILRLHTVGGVAPAGPCDPRRQPTVEVPYRADYVFIAG